MAEITHRRKGELLRGLFSLLAGAPDGLPAGEALQALAQRVPPTGFEAGNYESGRRYEKIVRFVTVQCVKAGWMIKHKGRWRLTEAGETALREFPDPEAFSRQAMRLYRQWSKSQPEPESGDADSVEDSPALSASFTLEDAEGMAWQAIEQFLRVMPPYEFQQLVGDLLKALGYHVAWTAPPGKDGGVDLIAFNDPLGTRPPRIKVQVKRNADSPKIDVAGLRSFLAVLGEDDIGLFVALSGFTRDAEHEARHQATRRVTLIDLPRFVDLWTEHYPRLDDAARRRFPLRPVWFLAGED